MALIEAYRLSVSVSGSGPGQSGSGPGNFFEVEEMLPSRAERTRTRVM